MIGQQAVGKWLGILTALGVDSSFLTGKHVPCPMCGGKDRFRFSNKDGKGLWVCNHCGGGDGFTLLMKVTNMDFKSCANRVKEVIGNVDHVATKKPIDTVKLLRSLWRASSIVQPGDIVDRYLSSRLVDERPKAIRTVASCRTSIGQYHPAMLALVSDAAGKPVTLHRTYVGEAGKADVESSREMMPGKIPDGSAIRLFPAQPRLGIAEGIETALSAAKLFGLPVWAAINATMLEKWTPPTSVESVMIFADNDHNYRGQKAAYCLAHKLSVNGLKVQVSMPETIGYDWNDVLMNPTHRR